MIIITTPNVMLVFCGSCKKFDCRLPHHLAFFFLFFSFFEVFEITQFKRNHFLWLAW